VDIGKALPTDVTRELLAELIAFKARFDALIAVSHDGIAHVDDQGIVVRWNPAAERLTGIADASAIGRPLEALVLEGARDVFESSGEPQTARLAFASASGELRVHADVVPIRGGAEIEGWLICFAAPQRHDQIERLKSELVASVSHALKTPLSSIKAYVDTLRASDARITPEERADYLATVAEEADRLGAAIEKLLMVSRVEARQLLKRRAIVPLDEVLDAALARVRPDPATHPVLRETQGVRISGDPELLAETLSHVLDNAVKFSPAGGALAVRAHRSDQRCVIDVIDRGIGIASENLPYVFDRFYRVNADLAAPIEGAGLGLFIALALVRAHGGTIDIRSELGSGSTVTISIPERA
jgi:PAS domain S-box-containing protein